MLRNFDTDKEHSQNEPSESKSRLQFSNFKTKFSNLSFSSIEINRPLPAPVYKFSNVRFKFKSQLQLLLQIKCLITLRVESRIIITDRNITDNITKKVINVEYEKCRTKKEQNLEEFQQKLDLLAETSHPEPLETAHY